MLQTRVLTRDHVIGRNVFQSCQINLKACGPISLCPQSRDAGGRLHKLLFDDGEFCANIRIIKTQKHLANINIVAVASMNSPNNPAIGMLDDLPVAFDFDQTRRDHRASDARLRTPNTK